jgi:hypothetical protein
MKLRAEVFDRRPNAYYIEPAKIVQINSRSCKPNDFDSAERMTHENFLMYYATQPDFDLDKYDI